jgi:hypothetical protein
MSTILPDAINFHIDYYDKETIANLNLELYKFVADLGAQHKGLTDLVYKCEHTYNYCIRRIMNTNDEDKKSEYVRMMFNWLKKDILDDVNSRPQFYVKKDYLKDLI